MQSTEQILASTPGSSQLPASSQTPSRVLVVEPHPTLRTVLVQRLRQDGHLAAAVGSAAEAIDLCREQSPDLLVSAEILEQNTAMRLAQQLGSSVIVLTARSGVEALVNLLDEGADDVLSDFAIREGIKEYSEWPTIPHVYLKGEFLGGSDILIEMYNSGSLKEKIEIELAS